MLMVHLFHDFDRFIAAAFRGIGTDEKVALGRAVWWRHDGRDDLYFKPMRWRAGTVLDGLGLHVNCSVFRSDATDAKAASATRCFIAMLDDVGDMPGKSVCSLDRVLALGIKPHAYIVTRTDSEGRVNGQVFFFIEPASIAEAASLVRAAARAGLCDPHASGGVRWARPPGSIKIDLSTSLKASGNGHVADLVMDNLALPRISLAALAEAMGLRIDDDPANHRAKGNVQSKPPPGVVVIAALDAIVNDLDREDWVKFGLALKTCSGPPPALSDGELFELFDAFSRQHPSYKPEATRRFWLSAASDRLSFGTVALGARNRGWRPIESEVLREDAGLGPEDAGLRRRSGQAHAAPRTFDELLVPDNSTARRALRAFGAKRALVVPPVLLPWFLPDAGVRHVLAVASAQWGDAFAWLGDVNWRLQRKAVVVRLRTLDEPQAARTERERRPLESAAQP